MLITVCHPFSVGVSDNECTRLNLRFFNAIIDSAKLARLLKKSTIACPVKADAKNCSTVMDQSGSADDAILDGFPLRSGDWKILRYINLCSSNKVNGYRQYN